MSFFQTLDFDFADGFADPLAGVRLFGFQVNARGRLRQHDRMTCQMAVITSIWALPWKPTMIGLSGCRCVSIQLPVHRCTERPVCRLSD
jgi:hypothetical protein